LQALPVYVISLKSATDRQAQAAAHLGALNIQYELCEAVRGDALEPQRRQQINPAGNMSPAQIGCYVSHIQIYERMVQEGTTVALILEDDAVLHPLVSGLVHGGCQTLDFDYCFLGCDDSGDSGYVYFDSSKATTLTSRLHAYPISSGPFCLHAYLITLDGARKRLQCAYPARSAIDHYHYLPYQPRFLAVVPLLAFVSELSAVHSMSSFNMSALQAAARQYWWYYPLRDVLKFKILRKWRARRSTVFPWTGRWESFESSLKVVRRSKRI
jgi:GR25 family glycosyltransferase involved in LPS biosynthesis